MMKIAGTGAIANILHCIDPRRSAGEPDIGKGEPGIGRLESGDRIFVRRWKTFSPSLA